MERNEMLQKISKDTGMNLEQIEKIYQSMAQVISDTLCQGEEVALMPELGLLIPKPWDNTGLDENSPRTRRPAHYKIRFRTGSKLQKALTISPVKTTARQVEEVREEVRLNA